MKHVSALSEHDTPANAIVSQERSSVNHPPTGPGPAFLARMECRLYLSTDSAWKDTVITLDMNKTAVSSLILIAGLFVVTPESRAVEPEFTGELSGWGSVSSSEAARALAGARYIPRVSAGGRLSRSLSLDVDLSVNVYGTGQVGEGTSASSDGDIDFYRLWIRLSSARFEARIGLQKITFGSSQILRPLMWFDRLDPRDPLQITEGVRAVLLRYYFQNNANIWLWGLYGNEEAKGWELVPTDADKPEFGGRFQFPLTTGELAFSYHHRYGDIDGIVPPLFRTGETSIPENRFGIDGKWDLTVGFWIEGALIHRDTDFEDFRYERFASAGLDYTFGLGNGLTAATEYFSFTLSDRAFGAGQRLSLSTLSLSYPVGLLDSVKGMIYYDFENRNWYRFIDWQRTYDALSLHVIGFWNPEGFGLYGTQAGSVGFSGSGLQFMIVWNH